MTTEPAAPLQTETAVGALAKAARADVERGIELVRQGLAVFRYVEDHVGWIGGATGRMKPKCKEIELATDVIRDELGTMLRKITGEPLEEITEHVADEKVAAVMRARAAEDSEAA